MWKQIYQLYQKEIIFLERKADESLVEIIRHETKMNKRKQQKLQPDEGDVNQLHEMIISMLKMMAVIESYRYFQLLKIPLTDQNMRLFYFKTDNYFENLLQRELYPEVLVGNDFEFYVNELLTNVQDNDYDLHTNSTAKFLLYNYNTLRLANRLKLLKESIDFVINR